MAPEELVSAVRRRPFVAFRITLTEGRHHQIRRMCDAFGCTVRSLNRIRIMNLQLARLAPGAYRELKNQELQKFLVSLGLNP